MGGGGRREAQPVESGGPQDGVFSRDCISPDSGIFPNVGTFPNVPSQANLYYLLSLSLLCKSRYQGKNLHMHADSAW